MIPSSLELVNRLGINLGNGLGSRQREALTKKILKITPETVSRDAFDVFFYCASIADLFIKCKITFSKIQDSLGMMETCILGKKMTEYLVELTCFVLGVAFLSYGTVCQMKNQTSVKQ
jgi:hypothetical protein